MDKLENNIYESLGLRRLDYAEILLKDNDLYVHSDGSVSAETTQWALNKLGFLNSETVEFHCSVSLRVNNECVNISPAYAIKSGLKLYLRPSAQKIGYYSAEYGGIGDRSLFTQEYSQAEGDGIEKAFEDAISAIAETKKDFPAGITENLYTDHRYVYRHDFWSWLFQKSKSWYFEGKRCKLIRIWLAGENEKFCPEILP